MKTFRLLTFLLLVASPAAAQLLQPAPDRLADYHAWFDPFNPATGDVAPTLQIPDQLQIDTLDRDWSRWVPNIPTTNLPGPITGITDGLYAEVVFLGETGDCWGRFGYTNSGADRFLSASGADRQFGNYALPLPVEHEQLDFFVERTTDSGTSERYYAFQHALNSPFAPPSDGYWGTLYPLTSVRGDIPGLAGDSSLPFQILAFAPDISSTNTDSALFVFAVRAGFFKNDQAVPEPATFGLAGAAALLALIIRRRARRAGAQAG